MSLGAFYSPSDESAQSFVHVASRTTIPKLTVYTIAENWAARARAKHKSNASLTAKELSAVEWSWPDFDAVVQELLRDDLWPTPWHNYEAKLKAGKDLNAVRAKIFVQTVRAAATSLRKSRDHIFISQADHDGWHIYTDSDVSAHFLDKGRTQSVRLRDWKTWPPLYPGDQSRLAIGMSGLYTRNGKFFGLGVERPFWA